MNQELRALLEKMVLSLQKQVEEKVPETGIFEVVYEREEVENLHIGLSHLILKVTNVGVTGAEDERYLDLGGVNYPSPYGCVSTIGFGHTKDIIAKLKEEGLVDLLEEKVKHLADEIDYDRRHPYG